MENTYWQLEREYHTITTDHDLVVRVIEHEEITRVEGGQTIRESRPTKVHEFKVKRETLIRSATYFSKLLGGNGHFKEASQDTVDLHDDAATGVTVSFKLLHKDVTANTYDIDLRGVWHTLLTAHKYGFDPKSKAAKEWFGKWFDKNKGPNGKAFDYEDYQTLLFPCHSFDYAPGFRDATKYLAYHAKAHITERRPEGFKHDHLRLDAIIIQQLNAAKGRLKTILHRHLYDPIEKLLSQASCRCKANVLYSYEKALTKTGAWPLETAFVRKSMQMILSLLRNFPGHNTETCGGMFCSFDFAGVVSKARAEVKGYFDGLCLDCVDASMPKLRDADEDY